MSSTNGLELVAKSSLSKLDVRQISAGVLEDGKLVESCLAQNSTAWTRLYETCHDSLVSAIRSILRSGAADKNLVDEIAARVWYALVRDDAKLLTRFDVTRGCRLTTFLSAIAKNEVRQFFRSERRRRHRERIVSRSELDSSHHFTSSLTNDHEFLLTLTPGERDYYESVLISAGDEGEDKRYSQENSWQLRYRVRKKLDKYIDSNL